MRCPVCLSKDVTYERSSGMAGYRCVCGTWSYNSHMRADTIKEPEAMYECVHCTSVYYDHDKAYNCCNPIEGLTT